nr:MAG TPA: hypothetical protein [Caudoviricetes sp.]
MPSPTPWLYQSHPYLHDRSCSTVCLRGIPCMDLTLLGSSAVG